MYISPEREEKDDDKGEYGDCVVVDERALRPYVFQLASSPNIIALADRTSLAFGSSGATLA